MYQLPIFIFKCPYSYFFESVGVLRYGVFFPASILKVDLNLTEIRTVQDYVCSKN